MNDPGNPLGWPVWKRGARLGLVWAALFFASTGALFVLMGFFGFSDTARAVCAALAGPLLASALIGAWWLARRPVLAGMLAPRGDGDDDRDGRGDAPAL